jgi:hypothetical protein
MRLAMIVERAAMGKGFITFWTNKLALFGMNVAMTTQTFGGGKSFVTISTRVPRHAGVSMHLVKMVCPR